MSRNNLLYLIIGALVLGTAILGYKLYQDRQQPDGVVIKMGPDGVSIQPK